MNRARDFSIRTLLALGTLAVGRWLALVATAYFSLFHWMRSEYLEFSHIWQYGLPLLDPRVAAALQWWILYSLFLGLLLLPAAHWLAVRLPATGAIRWATWISLALGLGTRGIAGPIVMRAAVTEPVRLLPGGGEAEGGLLTETALARGLTALTEAWWLLPALVVAIRVARGTPLARHLRGGRAVLLLTLYALVQSPETTYLLTGGGPRGATANLPLLAFQLGFGGQEFGYASVLTVLMSAIVVAGSLLALRNGGLRETTSVPETAPSPANSSLWWLALPVCGLPLLAAYQRNPPEAVGEPRLWSWVGVSLATALAAAAWTCLLLPALLRILEKERRGRFARAFLLGPLLLPSLTWVLPAVRVLGEQRGWIDAATPSLGLILGTPYLYLGLGVLTLARRRMGDSARALLTTGFAVAWATWTDVLNALMLTQTGGGAQLLPTGIVWKLSTHLWTSPLSTPGWAESWLGATALALPVLLLLRPDIHHERANSPQ